MLVIWWGRNVYKRAAGVATQYCVVCTEVRPLELLDVSTSEHVMGLATSQEQYLGRLRSCKTCGAEWLFAPGPNMPGPVHLDPQGCEALKRQRTELEERARSRQVTPAERTSLLREPFQLMNIAIASRGQNKKMDGLTLAFVVATFLVPFVVGVGGCATKGDTKHWGDALMFALFVPPIVLALVTAVVAAGEPKRFARKHVVSKIAPALRALNPSPLEISRILADLRAQGFAVAEYVAAADVMRALETA